MSFDQKKSVKFGIQVPATAVEQLEAIAKSKGGNRNKVVNEAISLFLESQSEKAKTPAA